MSATLAATPVLAEDHDHHLAEAEGPAVFTGSGAKNVGSGKPKPTELLIPGV